MPHLTLQYTANLDGFDASAALAAANQALIDCGHFDELAIKSRAVRLDHFRVGGTDAGRGFVHAQLKIMPGRSPELRQALGQAVLDALRHATPASTLHCQLCVEVEELAASTYTKAILEPGQPESTP